MFFPVTHDLLTGKSNKWDKWEEIKWKSKIKIIF